MRLVLFILCFGASIISNGQSLDSLFTFSPDSILVQYQSKLDSVQYNFNKQSDSLKSTFRQRLFSLDSSRAKNQAAFDSLKSLQLPAEKYSQKLDSIKHQQEELVASLNRNMESLKSKTVDKIKNLNLPPQLQGKVGVVTKSIEDFKLPVKDFNLPSLNLPDNPLESLDGLNANFKSPFGNIGTLNDLPNIQENLDDVSQITNQVSGYQSDLQNIAKGNLDEVQQLPKALEERAADLGSADKIKEQTKVLDPLIASANNPDALKEQALDKAKEAVIDHFAGKEEQLKEAMEKMSELKQKYSSVNSLSAIPKKRPNEMRGRPLIERLRPGIAIQLQQRNDDFLTDLNPYVGYRFTTRLTSGLGWNQRVPYNFDKGIISHQAKVYGPRIFSEFKLKHGFTPRAELEVMNTFVPLIVQPGSTDLQIRQWVMGAFVGLKKEYHFIHSVKGTAMMMVRVFNHDLRSPYSDVINMRFGFEFPLKKKYKQP